MAPPFYRGLVGAHLACPLASGRRVQGNGRTHARAARHRPCQHRPAPPEVSPSGGFLYCTRRADEHDGCERSMAVARAVTSECPARDCSAGCNSQLKGFKQAGGSRFRCTLSLLTWAAAVTGPSFLCGNYRELSCRLCLGRSLRDASGKSEPQWISGQRVAAR